VFCGRFCAGKGHICFELEHREINDCVSDAYRGEDEQGREMAFKKVYI